MGDHRQIVICDHALMGFLHRAHAGEKPDLLMLELYANSDIEDVPGDGDAG